MENKTPKAFFLTKTGDPNKAFTLQNIQIPTLQEDELLIEVEAFGLNYADVMARNGLYKEAPPMPCIIGYEVVGKVIAFKKTENEKWLNKRVVAFTRFGGYSTHAITKDLALVEIGDMDSSIALGLCTQSVTAYYMSHYLAPIRPKDKVLIHAAAGGVGSILIQLAKQKGATVFAKIGSDDKSDLVKNLGADYIINYKKENYEETIQHILKAEKLDVIYNPVGGSTYKKDMTLLNAGGKLILFGGSELKTGRWKLFSQLAFVKKMGIVLPIGLMMQSKSILGVNMLKIADARPEVIFHCLNEVIQLYQNKSIIPQIGGVFNSNELHKAHDLLESGKSTGKIVVKWNFEC